MEEFKENKSAIITIVCFALIILGIVGYFVYDMLIKSKKADKSFDITLTEVSLKVNEVKDIKNYITLENIELNEIIFTSSDKGIAYIEDATIVAPSKEGIAIITATYKKIVKKITIKVGDVKVSTGTDVVTKTDDMKDNIQLDLSRCINPPFENIKYSDAKIIDSEYKQLKLTSGLLASVKKSDDSKNAVLTFDWGVYCKQADVFSQIAEICPKDKSVVSYKIIGFDNEINDVYLLGGQTLYAASTRIIYLMKDGTVEFTQLFKFGKENGNREFELNLINEYSSDNKLINQYFKTEGKLVADAKNILRLYYTHVAESMTYDIRMIGVTSDGSFYDMWRK